MKGNRNKKAFLWAVPVLCNIFRLKSPWRINVPELLPTGVSPLRHKGFLVTVHRVQWSGNRKRHNISTDYGKTTSSLGLLIN